KEGGISPHAIPDPVFNYHGVVTMLLGQQVACPRPAETWLSKAAWDARVAESRKLIGRALTQQQALALLRQRPELLENLVTPNSKSWIVSRTPHAGPSVSTPSAFALRAVTFVAHAFRLAPDAPRRERAAPQIARATARRAGAALH